MKVTLINTSDAGGGAPIACMRLLKALELKQVDVQMQVQEKKTNEPRVKVPAENVTSELRIRFNFLHERLPFIWSRAKDKSLRFAFSTADAGTDVRDEPAVSDADILHLHWTNSGYLSTDNLKKLFETGKPVVWTLHDMWAFTGGCHYSGDCDHFINQCGNCWMLRNAGDDDISHKGWIRKNNMLEAAKNIVFVTCSHWLADVARTSSLLKGFRIETIPNPIDTEVFSPKDKIAAKEKWNIYPKSKIILFGAANILDRRKGITYLVEALNQLKNVYTDVWDAEIVIFGKNKSFDVNQIPFKVHELNIITSQHDLAEIYSLADVFVTPAIEDNLPNTVMEALACGTPVVAFNTGGIPDMVDHKKNGYLAEFKSPADFAAGINYVLNSPFKDELVANARKKVLNNFTNEIVASKYMAVYKSILKMTDFKPALSVITVVYNNVKDIKQTMLSVLNQTWPNIEYIVVDGLSTDGTLKVINHYKSKIAKLISEKDEGIYDAMNKGLAAATGDYVIFINSGDEFYDKDTVEKVFAPASGADIYYGETEMIDAEGQSLGQRRHKTPEHFTWRSFKYGMNISHQAIYIRRSLTGPYDSRYYLSADIDWIIRAAKKAKKIVNVNQYVAKYRVGGMSKTRHRLSLMERFDIMRRYYGLLPTLFNHGVIAFNLGWYWVKHRKTND